ncbi:MAG: TraB/GumN family protein [Chromatiaceae bacterium]|nr:TraB/GumN family protein [Chromatiaceae bacterium]
MMTSLVNLVLKPLARLAGLALWLLLVTAAVAGGERGLLFEISTPVAPSCFLFGTFHSEDPRVLALSPATRDAFERSPVFILEMIPDAQALARSLKIMVYGDGRDLARVAGAPLYGRLVEAVAELGLPEEAIRGFKPWAAATLLGLPPARTGEFLDIHLYRTALAAGKQVIGLETIEEQVAVFDSLGEDDQILMLKETLDTRDQLPLVFERLLEAYLDRDFTALALLGDGYLGQGDPRLAEKFRRAALDDRNLRMAARLDAYLSSPV